MIKNYLHLKYPKTIIKKKGMIKKLCSTSILTLLTLLIFQAEANAEGYRVKEVHENYYVFEFEGLNIGLWPWYTRVRVFTNNPSGSYTEKTITTGGKYTMNIYYKGNAGTNNVYSTAIVYLASYGPYLRDNFQAPLLKSPAAFTATDDELNKVILNWENKTAYADSEIEYLIYKGSQKIATVAGNLTTYTVSGLQNGEEHTYTIKTSLKGTNRVSADVRAVGRAFAFDLTASVDKVNKVVLNWNTTSKLGDGYTLTRDDGIDVIVVDASIPSHQGNLADDDGLLPGVYMNYKIVANQDDSHFSNAAGRSRPNGKISGTVTTPYGDPIGGVTIKIERTNLPEDTVQKVFYATSSNDDGSYENEAIYYGYDGADFVITPQFEGHMFDPDSIRKSLSPNYPSEGGVHFKDTTALTVKGQVLNQGCPVQGVSILVDGFDKQYLTDENGNFTAIVSEPGTHSLKPMKEGHSFDPEEVDNIEILDNIVNVDFEDTTAFVLRGYLAASCNNYIGTGNLRFFTNGSCVDVNMITNDTGYYEILLPPNKYNVELTSFTSDDELVVASDDVMAYFVQPMSIDLENSAVYDTTLKRYIANLDLTYRLPPVLSVNILDRSETCDEQSVILEQLKEYEVVVSVNETFNEAVCHSESGYLVIEQDITSSDIEVDTVWFENGKIDTLLFKIGIPNIVDPYLNTFRITAFVGNYTETVEYDVLIVGHRPRTSTYTTVSPSLPFLILHDPPGDGSFSFKEESSSMNYSFGLKVAVDNTLKVYSSAKLGVNIIKGQFILSETEQYLEMESGLSIGISLESETSFSTSVKTAKNFSTSANDNIVGAEGDVYVGGALNLIYAMTDIIEYNYTTCEAEKTVSLAMEPNGFATTFMYTESHIADVLIPQLETIADKYEVAGNDSALIYDKQVDEWQQIVDNNHENIDNAEFVENISISGGTEYSSSIESTGSWQQTINSSLSLGLDFKLEFGLEESGTGFKVGLENQFKFEIGTSHSFGGENTHTTGFTITDDDPGDYISMDILTDKVYGTPAFKLKAGTTSCPWEKETQAREGLQLRSDNYTVTVDDPKGEAVFLLQLANISESDEDMSYDLIFDPTSNPHGALVSIGGSPVVGNVPTPYDIPAGGFVNATVTVKKGPYSSEFKNLKFILSSSCDGKIKDEVYLNAIFETDCGDIHLEANDQSQVISENTGNSLSYTVSDYTKENLNSINFRISSLSSDWSNHFILTGDAIENEETVVDLSFDQVADGEYFLMATAMCSDAAIESDIIRLTIDRTAPSVNMLKPIDKGALNIGNDISVSFSEDILSLSSEDISIIRQRDNLDVPFQSGCSPRKLVLLPESDILQDGDTLTITVSNVQDIYANTMNPFSWSFAIPDVEEIFEDPMLDSDKDGIPDASDICILVYNPDQEDMDGDLIGDACDDDIDGDGVLNFMDKCPLIDNEEQLDNDNDGIGDLCDSDIDGDAISNEGDNCPFNPNKEQEDLDLDGIGNDCDDDIDGDGYDNDNDNCPYYANPDQTDSDNNGIGDACENTGENRELDLAFQFNIYPNPSNSDFNLELNIKEVSKVKVELCNSLGQIIHVIINEKLLPGEVSRKIETGGLPEGIYYIRLILDGNSFSEKLVKIQ